MRQLLTPKTKITFAIFLLITLFLIQYYYHQNKKSLTNLSQPQEIHDPYKYLHIIPNHDGTITRLLEFYPTIPPNTTSSLTLSKDVPLNPFNVTRVRIFLPRVALNGSNTPTNKLPIIVYAHGGGFILYSAASPVFHNFCAELASQLGAMVVSVEYRLAPESRLPAAYEDVLGALNWVKEGKDEWVKEHGDFSRCFLMGQSAGANIVYQAGLNALDHINELKPLIINGLILVQPFFGGLNRTGSELRLVHDPFLPLVVNDLSWDLGLPVGANRSHVFCDPITHERSENLGQVKDLGWRVLVVGCDGDPLLDRQLELVKMLEVKGVIVESMFSEGGHHGVFGSDPNQRDKLFDLMKKSLRDS